MRRKFRSWTGQIETRKIPVRLRFKNKKNKTVYFSATKFITVEKKKRQNLVKGFVTYKCLDCNNVMRQEYNPKGKHSPCCVCLQYNWVEIRMDEVN